MYTHNIPQIGSRMNYAKVHRRRAQLFLYYTPGVILPSERAEKCKFIPITKESQIQRKKKDKIVGEQR